MKASLLSLLACCSLFAATSLHAGVERRSVGGTPLSSSGTFGYRLDDSLLHHPSLDLVFFSDKRLYSVNTSSGVFTELLPAKTDANGVDSGWEDKTISADGSYLVAHASDGSLWSVPATGGTAVMLAPEVDSFVITLDSTRVAYISDDVLWSVPITGGAPTLVMPPAWLVTGGTVNSVATIPGTNLLLFEGRDPSLSYDALYRVTPQGAGLTALTFSNSVDDYRVNSSGSHAIYKHHYGIYSVKLSGTPAVIPLAGTASSNLLYDVALTPDGNTVIFAAENSNSLLSLFTVPVTGGTPAEIITSGLNQGLFFDFFQLSLDGNHVVYFEDWEHLYSVPTSGGAAVLLSETASGFYQIWAGAGHVAFMHDENGVGKDELMVADLSTGTRQLILADTDIYSPQMSPDGSKIFFGATGSKLYETAMDGSSTIELSSSSTSLDTSTNICLNGTTTKVFAASSAQDTAHVATAGAAGSASLLPNTVPAKPGRATIPLVSPDERYVAYVSQETTAGEYHLYLASADGGSAVMLTSLAYSDSSTSEQAAAPCQFTKDSRWVVFWDNASHATISAYRIADGLRVVLSDPSKASSLAAIREIQNDVLFITDGELWRHPLDGTSGTAENLTAGLMKEISSFENISPDGTQALIFTTDRDLILITLDGTTATATVKTYTSYRSTRPGPMFLPDGSALLFFGENHDSLGRYDLNSGATTKLASFTGDNIERAEIAGGHVIVQLEDYDGYVASVSLSTGTVTTLTGDWFGDKAAEDEWQITSDGSTLVYSDESASGQYELYAIPVSGGTAVKISGALPAGGNVTNFAITPDDSLVIYRADKAANERFELFSVPITGGTSTRLSAAMTSTADVHENWLTSSAQHVLYLSDLGHPGYQRLYGASLIDGSITELTDPALPTWATVTEFATAGNGSRVIHTADAALSGQWTLFSAAATPAIGPIANPSSLINATVGPITFTVSDLEIPASDLQITVQSSNAGLLDPNIAVLGGSGSSRTLTLTPNTDAWGRTLVTLLVSDAAATSARQFTWTVAPDANDVPSNIALAPASIQENQPAGTLVGYLSATDADAWDIHSYSLVSGSGDGDNHLFLIDGGALRATVPYDFEARSAFSIRVRVTDFVGATFEKVLFVSVLDLRGISQPVTLTTREGMGRFFEAQDFIDRFTLQDGGSLAKIRIESAPMHGSLNYQLGRRDIDTAANAAQALATGDVNGDGRPDIIAVLPGSGDVVWYENGGGASPTFTRRHIASVLNQPRDVAVGDVDKDGDLDVFVAEHGANKILCFRSSGGSTPTFAPITVFSGAGGLSSLTTADIDGDTDLDVISTHQLGHRVMIHRNDGAATPGFIGSVLSTTETGAADAVVFDADLDGDLDIVSAAATSGDIAWFEQNGASFIRRAIATGLPQPSSLARADINGDSRSDLVIATSGDNSVNWYQNIPPATSGAALAFMPNLVSSSLAGVTHVLATDFTGDTVPDIIACSPVDGRILGFQTFRGGVVGFATHQLDKNAAGAAAVASTDFTANGRPDLVACHASANTIAWYQDERLLIGGDEVTVHELHKIRYQPHMSFTGDDAFGWRGHDGVQWSFHPSVVTLKVITGEYWDWLVDAFGVESVSDFSESVTTWGDSADADGDGRSNLLEYAFGGDPTSGSDSGDAVATAPQTESDGTTYFHLSFIMRHSDPDLIYTPEVTADFTTWNSGPTYFQHVAPDVVLDTDFTQVTYRYLVPVTSGSPAGFFRIKVERAP